MIRICQIGGCNNYCEIDHTTKTGQVVYKRYCSYHAKATLVNENSKYSRYQKLQTRKNYCENIDGRLGFVCESRIVNMCQLTCDHINTERSDSYNTEENVQTLCHNCHAVKTLMERYGYWDAEAKCATHRIEEIRFPTGVMDLQAPPDIVLVTEYPGRSDSLDRFLE